MLRSIRSARRAFAVSAAVLGVLALAACGGGEEEAVHDATLFVFGTKVDITVRGVDAATAQAATAKLEQEFQRMHKDWHAWKPGELTQVNAAIAAGRSTPVSPFVKPVIVEGRRLEQLSDGLFNPAIGAIIEAWGFHSDERPKGHRPDLAAIRALAATRPSMADMTFAGDVLSSSNPHVQFDFGGFAKGVALDRAEAVLKSFGVENALVNAGGDINTMGRGGGARPWQVGIRDPKAWGVIAILELAPGEDVYTSGNYERFREIDGVRYAHIIDPRTGMPVEHIVSSTVIATSGALADAAATALSVAGPEDWHRIAKRMGVKYAVLVDDQGTVYLNPAMRARITFAPDQEFKIVESPPL